MFRRSVLALLPALVFSFAPSVIAQEVATTRFYVVPKTGTGAFPDTIRPKYMREAGVQWEAMNYGLEDTFLVAAKVTPTQHASFSGNIDVIALPADIDSNIGLTALAAVKTRLEGMFVPADDLTTGKSYRQAVRSVGLIFQLMQRFHGLFGEKFFRNGGDLDTQLKALSDRQTKLLSAAQDLAASQGFQLDTSGIKGTTTVREALHIVAAQFQGFTLGGFNF